MPFVFAGVFALRHPKRLTRDLAAEVLPALLIPIALSLVLRWLVVGESIFINKDLMFVRNPLIDAPFWTSMWTAFAVLGTYVSKTFVPLGFSATYSFNHFPLVTNPLASAKALGGMASLLALLACIAHPRTRTSALGIGAAIFLLTYPLISRFAFKGMGGEILQEHWIYMPSVGFALMAAWVLMRLHRRSPAVAWVALAVIAAMYVPLAMQRNRVWRTEKAFYEALLIDAPDSVQAHLNIAIRAFNDHRLDIAKREALAAYRIHSGHHRLLNLLGRIALAEGQLPEAEAYFLESIHLRPQYPDTHKFYAFALAKQGMYQQSLQYVSKFLADHPGDAQLRFLAAVNLYKMGREEDLAGFLNWDPALSREESMKILEAF
jgi:hypothetical protein